MSQIDRLLQAFEQRVSLPLQSGLSGMEKVWFCIYPPKDERRVRARLTEFERLTREAGLNWRLVDLTLAFEQWLANHEYGQSYYRDPDLLDPATDDLREEVIRRVRSALEEGDERTLTAVLGAASLFGMMRLSGLVEDVCPAIRGRMLVFFPGRRDGNNYRLLDARDGWNYLAVPIEAT